MFLFCLKLLLRGLVAWLSLLILVPVVVAAAVVVVAAAVVVVFSRLVVVVFADATLLVVAVAFVHFAYESFCREQIPHYMVALPSKLIAAIPPHGAWETQKCPTRLPGISPTSPGAPNVHPSPKKMKKIRAQMLCRAWLGDDSG